MRAGRRIWPLISVLLVGGMAYAESLPADRLAKILLKSLTYDRNLKLRSEGGVRIGVVSLASDAGSAGAGAALLKEIQRFQGKKVKGLPLSVEGLEVQEASEVFRAVDEKKLNVLFLTPGCDPLLSKVVGLAKVKKVLIFSGDAKLAKAGAAIGISQQDGKPKITVNLSAAKEQGADLDDKLLKLAEVTK